MNDMNTLGGHKSRMLPSSTDILVTYRSARKPGYYELSLDGKELARRVELPPWMNERANTLASGLLAALQKNQVTIPPEHSHERQGHIFWDAAPLGFSVPAVGIDREIAFKVLPSGKLEKIWFMVFLFGKTLCERWTIAPREFGRVARLTPRVPGFEPQLMVPVTALKRE
ncbi:MAG TPA: hypothetical protein VFQ72_02960 [Candidatus Paceibacterota bacterium]|nr:hypothetical protein [Candidatus Paceibacterota bacterium]